MQSFLRDLRFGLRLLGKDLGFTVGAVLILAAGIGATTAIFTVANALLLRPFPYPDAGRLVIPTFALERAQELLFFLRQGVEQNRLPPSSSNRQTNLKRCWIGPAFRSQK